MALDQYLSDLVNRTSSNSSISSMSRSSRSSIADFPFLNPTRFSFDCIYPECNQKFELTNDLYDHVREHNKELICPMCDNKYKCMASLIYHVRTHTGNKPYVCPLPLCKFVTATKGNLKAHLLSNQHKLSNTIQLYVSRSFT